MGLGTVPQNTSKKLANYFTFLCRSSLRTAVLAFRFPRAAAVAMLQKAFRGRPFSVTIKNCKDRHVLKEQAKKTVLPVGWASTGRSLEISLAGKRLMSIALAEGAEANAQQFYFSRSLKDMRAALRVFAKHGKSLPVHHGALVFEPGCNAGRYLYYFADRYGCRIFGADVYAPAVDVAESAAIFPGEKFMVSDLVCGKALEAFADHHFDLVFLSSHLAHVTHLPGGVKAYLGRLMRVARTVIFIEMHKNETEAAARELGFWIAPWKHSLLGHFSHENSSKTLT